MNFFLLTKLLLAVAVWARANAVSSGIDNDRKPGSYHEASLDGSSFAAEDVIEEGDLEFYGWDVEHEHKNIDEDDDDLETLEFIQNLVETSDELKYIENFEDVLIDVMTTHDVDYDQRNLILDLPSVHCDCISNSYYFNIEIKITPSSDASLGMCSLLKRRRLGNHINAMLLDLGVGAAGVGDNVVFLAKVCNTPSTFRRRLLDGSTEGVEDDEMEEELDTERDLLKLNGFVYAGGGPCRGCPGDNYDRRKLQTATATISGFTSGSSSSMTSSSTTCVGSACTTINTFCAASGPNNCGCNLDFYGFLNDLNQRVKQYMKNTVVPNNQICCGTTPGITVTTTAVSGNNVNYGC